MCVGEMPEVDIVGSFEGRSCKLPEAVLGDADEVA